MWLNLSTWLDTMVQELMVFWQKIAETYKYDKNLAATMFIEEIHTPRNGFIGFCNTNGLNHSSFWWVLLEWYLLYIVKWWLHVFNKENDLEVHNNYSLKYKWKEEGQAKSVNIDVVLKSKKSTKLYYCLELKTNFEDGFAKYYREQNQIYHHRTKTYKDFKYHYIALGPIPNSLYKKEEQKIKTLIRRCELWCFPSITVENKHEQIERWENLLRYLYEPML